MLTPAAAAQASDYSQVLHATSSAESIPPCKFSTSQLSGALKGVNLYGAQYFADFTAAIQNALSARAGGSCLADPVSPAAASTGGSGPVGSSNLRLPPGNVTAPTQAGLPAPILLLAVLAAAIGLIAALVGLARLRGWEPGSAAVVAPSVAGERLPRRRGLGRVRRLAALGLSAGGGRRASA